MHDEAVLGGCLVNRAVFLRVWQDRCETHDVHSKGGLCPEAGGNLCKGRLIKQGCC